ASLDLALSLAAAGINLTANVVEALEGVVVYTINGTLGSAAAVSQLCTKSAKALLGLVAKLADGIIHTVEAIQDVGVLGVEAITQAVFQAVQLVHDRLVVKSSLEVSTGSRSATAGIIAPAAPTTAAPHAKQQEQQNPGVP